jgi:hypothetical protein
LPVCNGGIKIDKGEQIAVERLIERSGKVIRVAGATPDEAYLNAGRRVADLVDWMIFVWDGGPSRGHGGTADIVAYARKNAKKGVILDPIGCSVSSLD